MHSRSSGGKVKNKPNVAEKGKALFNAIAIASSKPLGSQSPSRSLYSNMTKAGHEHGIDTTFDEDLIAAASPETENTTAASQIIPNKESHDDSGHEKEKDAMAHDARAGEEKHDDKWVGERKQGEKAGERAGDDAAQRGKSRKKATTESPVDEVDVRHCRPSSPHHSTTLPHGVSSDNRRDSRSDVGRSRATSSASSSSSSSAALPLATSDSRFTSLLVDSIANSKSAHDFIRSLPTKYGCMLIRQPLATFSKGWKKRYVALSGGRLYWHEDEDMLHPTNFSASIHATGATVEGLGSHFHKCSSINLEHVSIINREVAPNVGVGGGSGDVVATATAAAASATARSYHGAPVAFPVSNEGMSGGGDASNAGVLTERVYGGGMPIQIEQLADEECVEQVHGDLSLDESGTSTSGVGGMGMLPQRRSSLSSRFDEIFRKNQPKHPGGGVGGVGYSGSAPSSRRSSLSMSSSINITSPVSGAFDQDLQGVDNVAAMSGVEAKDVRQAMRLSREKFERAKEKKEASIPTVRGRRRSSLVLDGGVMSLILIPTEKRFGEPIELTGINSGAISDWSMLQEWTDELNTRIRFVNFLAHPMSHTMLQRGGREILELLTNQEGNTASEKKAIEAPTSSRLVTRDKFTELIVPLRTFRDALALRGWYSEISLVHVALTDESLEALLDVLGTSPSTGAAQAQQLHVVKLDLSRNALTGSHKVMKHFHEVLRQGVIEELILDENWIGDDGLETLLMHGQVAAGDEKEDEKDESDDEDQGETEYHRDHPSTPSSYLWPLGGGSMFHGASIGGGLRTLSMRSNQLTDRSIETLVHSMLGNFEKQMAEQREQDEKDQEEAEGIDRFIHRPHHSTSSPQSPDVTSSSDWTYAYVFDRLDFSCNNLSDPSMYLLSSLMMHDAFPVKIECLEMEQNALTDVAAEHLSKVIRGRERKQVGVGAKKGEHDGSNDASTAERIPCIRRVNLSSNHLTGTALRVLIDTFKVGASTTAGSGHQLPPPLELELNHNCNIDPQAVAECMELMARIPPSSTSTSGSDNDVNMNGMDQVPAVQIKSLSLSLYDPDVLAQRSRGERVVANGSTIVATANGSAALNAHSTGAYSVPILSSMTTATSAPVPSQLQDVLGIGDSSSNPLGEITANQPTSDVQQATALSSTFSDSLSTSSSATPNSNAAILPVGDVSPAPVPLASDSSPASFPMSAAPPSSSSSSATLVTPQRSRVHVRDRYSPANDPTAPRISIMSGSKGDAYASTTGRKQTIQPLQPPPEFKDPSASPPPVPPEEVGPRPNAGVEALANEAAAKGEAEGRVASVQPASVPMTGNTPRTDDEHEDPRALLPREKKQQKGKTKRKT